MNLKLLKPKLILYQPPQLIVIEEAAKDIPTTHRQINYLLILILS